MNPHSLLYAVIYVLAGAVLFMFALLCSIGFAVEGRCGASFGYYGCETPVVSGRK